MVAHPDDARLQDLGCEALARLAQSGEPAVVRASVQTLVGHADRCAIEVCCSALVRLRGSGICHGAHILDVLLSLTESQPANLEVQRRASTALRQLVRSGAVELEEARARATPLLSVQWEHLLARFAGAEGEEAQLNSRFHEEVQALFHEEVARHFEYEAAERTLHLVRRGAPGRERLREVVRCLVENLEDYQSRLEARELAWDAEVRHLVALDEHLRQRLTREALDGMELGLVASLREAASGGTETARRLSARRARLRAECAALLDRKTEATQAHQERASELRREVMLFEAVEYLELHAAEASTTQVRTAMHMLRAAAPAAPSDAVERLRDRLGHLAASRGAAASAGSTRAPPLPAAEGHCQPKGGGDGLCGEPGDAA